MSSPRQLKGLGHALPLRRNAVSKESSLNHKQLWLTLPRMDLPPNLINPLHSYADSEKIIVENWPAREAMIKAEGADPARFKRILGLTWAHTKPRRTVRTVDIEEEHSRTANADEGEDQDRSTVIDNVRKIKLFVPQSSANQ